MVDENVSHQNAGDRKTKIALTIFFTYVVVLALAAVSELFNLDWFNHPVFK